MFAFDLGAVRKGRPQSEGRERACPVRTRREWGFFRCGLRTFWCKKLQIFWNFV